MLTIILLIAINFKFQLFCFQLYTRDSEIINLESQLGLTKADCRDLENQMSVINNLFSQMLLGASSAEMDLDRLTQLLQVEKSIASKPIYENF